VSHPSTPAPIILHSLRDLDAWAAERGLDELARANLIAAIRGDEHPAWGADWSAYLADLCFDVAELEAGQ